MSARIRIAVDAMSGDLGPRVVISAVQKFISMFDDVDILLVGNEQDLHNVSSLKNLPPNRITIVHAPDVVRMDEDPLFSLRRQKKSSMWIALENVKNNFADACVSAGNTGALLAISKFLLKTFPGIERPAICKSMPVETGVTYLLDLGANINCSAENLYQFALMGNILASSEHPSPRICLLNIGTESAKGTDVIQAAQNLLQSDKHINYKGFVEANAIFTGCSEVIVCDGFHGNLVLKSSEGTARFFTKKIQIIFKKNWFMRAASLLLWPLIKQLRIEMDPSMYNGASFLGLQKIVVKSHGNANKKAFLQALLVAREQFIQKVPTRIQQQFSNY